MSSLKHLNHSIKLQRMQGKDSVRQCELSLNLLLYSVKKQTQKHPFGTTIGVTLATIIFAKYRKKMKSLYPIASLGVNYFRQSRS
ncbi:hypothetical protein [Shewanella sp. OMA3-2]|uniref:hypothetical protein n=1 Tax=Shewanella sp. OMA3-2 TaxID=2908650 RepID=UPI001F42DFA0|nr:hypothetical protein [Shewanella sp. OMA3-2]UJF22646.1 hypothetical protein L0B17_04405 [Shewanella sp. OMA3-2]